MSKAKQQAYQNAGYSQSSAGFASGFLLGQLTLALILFVFIKFFIFGEAPSADERAASRAASRRQRTLSHAAATTRQRALSSTLRPRPSPAILKARPEAGLTVQKILEKTYYNVHGHQPESLDWFNVLVAQTIAQLRADAQEDEAVLTSLTAVMNGPQKPDFLDEIKVTEISLGDEFPIFSNCRVIPVDENGAPLKELRGDRGERLQARMDVDLSDVVTLGIETKLVLNYPKPFVAVLPVALAVSVVRFSGTLSLSFSPSSQPSTQQSPQAYTKPTSPSGASPNAKGQQEKNEGHPLNPTGQSPTTLTFTFLDDYRLDLSVHSLIGSRSRLQDVPKIAQLVESRIHAWFDERCVEPRFQQIVLPSMWPRKKNTRGGEDMPSTDGGDGTSARRASEAVSDGGATTTHAPRSRKEGAGGSAVTPTGPDITAEQRTRDWAARVQSQSKDKTKDERGKDKGTVSSSVAGDATPRGKQKATATAAAATTTATGTPILEASSEMERAGEEMRAADEKERRRVDLHRRRTDRENGGGGGGGSGIRATGVSAAAASS